MEIRHVELCEESNLAKTHPQLLELRPDLAQPVLPHDPGLADADFPYLVYALADDRIVGGCRSFPDMLFKSDGNAFRWAWAGGLFTDSDYRGRGIAQQMINRQLQEFGRRNIIRGSVFSAPTAIRVFQRLNFSNMGHAPRLCIVRNARPFLRHHISSEFLISLSGATFAAAYAVAYGTIFRTKRSVQNYSIVAAKAADFAKLIEDLSFRRELFFWGKSHAWFDVRRASTDRIYLVSRVHESAPCAFLIVRERHISNRTLADYTNFSMMSVMEFGQFDPQPDSKEALVCAAVSLFNQGDADILEFVTSSPELQAVARTYGFFPLGSGMSFNFKAPSQFGDLPGGLRDWHLSQYCGDAFLFE